MFLSYFLSYFLSFFFFLSRSASLDPSIPVTFTRDNRVHIGPKMEMRVVTLGLDQSGKTAILMKLKNNEFMQVRLLRLSIYHIRKEVK